MTSLPEVKSSVCETDLQIFLKLSSYVIRNTAFASEYAELFTHKNTYSRLLTNQNNHILYFFYITLPIPNFTLCTQVLLLNKVTTNKFALICSISAVRQVFPI